MDVKKSFDDIKREIKYFFRHPIVCIDEWLFPFKWYKKLRGYGDFNGFGWQELAAKWGIDLDTSHIDEMYFTKDTNGVEVKDIFAGGKMNGELMDKFLEPNRKWFEELQKHKEQVKREVRRIIEDAASALLTFERQEEGRKIAEDIRQYCRAMARDIYGERELWRGMAKLDDYSLLKYSHILLEHMWT